MRGVVSTAALAISLVVSSGSSGAASLRHPPRADGGEAKPAAVSSPDAGTGGAAPAATNATTGIQHLGPSAPAQVKRVVTLAPSLTETVVALGAADRLVGVSRYDELPEVKSLPRVGGYLDPSVEAVFALQPELVLVQPSPGNQAPVQKLAELGVPVLSVPMHDVEETLAAIRAIGQALQVPARGEQIARRLEQARAEVRAQAAALPHPRVLFVYGFEPLVVAGPGSFADELLRDAGGVNVAQAASSPYPTYSVERAVADRPDVVVDASDAGGGQRLRSLLPSSRWVTVKTQALMHPGPKLEDGLRELFNLLHPK